MGYFSGTVTAILYMFNPRENHQTDELLSIRVTYQKPMRMQDTKSASQVLV
jgi:hypothetical protein